MSDHHEPQNPKPINGLTPPSSEKIPIGSSTTGHPRGSKYPNPPEITNPDPATLREQWRFAIRQYSRWYSHAWGTAILAGVSFFALGWFIKGSNPLPSFNKGDKDDDKKSAAGVVAKEAERGLQNE
ncbi:OLC1v1021407C1 [Oldenlandia corymbosa var. corymbosa]|uniref:OLC1v1021407C1 n=1 Tax=Oldenlandia corymbosa var. corymbosa TaxID=529605 RepID=A0AAV1BX25_OLDCO|nr:OLC1v1021407C1 [Oldenlandia corymbosa var. corymbosa]